ncbi:Por secretion system C-terminal sorting domain-containing protein [Kriegella aquimaris]|uniref:Por secretion system C-terminal sorting domain-containing protein n=2 Tax=Kriegella aquimaris TaxID=192904 RepID=A0A1G9M6F8_9FLAO|nr:Por secretion system C-terminal sorting domain-containing protein [Kriegella aquimaris]
MVIFKVLIPSRYQMKLTIFVLFIVFSIGLSAQETAAIQGQTYNEPTRLTVYPNPVFDEVVYVSTQQAAPKEIAIYDVFGKIVLIDRITTNALNISRLTPGVYVLQVVQDKKTLTRKLVVK